MAKVKHLSDGTNTWDVGGGTEVFTAPGGLWEMKITIDNITISGSMAIVAESAAEITSPGGMVTQYLAPALALGMQQGDIVHITFTGTLPADTIDSIGIGSMGSYSLTLSESGTMKSEYYATMTTPTFAMSTMTESAAPAPTVYDRLKVVAPLTVTNDGNDDCLGAAFSLPYQVTLGRQGTRGYDMLAIFDEDNRQIGITSYFNNLVPVIYGTWSNYDSTDECFTGISISDEDELAEDCILVVEPYLDGCCYAKITFDTALFDTKTVRFCNIDAGNSGTWYFTTTRKTYFRVTNDNGDIVLTPIENPSEKYNIIRNATDIDKVNYTPVKDSTATVNQIIGAMLAVYGWGYIDTTTGRTYILQTSSEVNINPQDKISLIKGREYVECQHFTAPVTGIYKLINAGGGRPIVPIKAVSSSPLTSNPNLCLKTSAVFYDNQTAAANRGWKLPKEASWPSDGNVSDYCYNFFIFGETPSGV